MHNWMQQLVVDPVAGIAQRLRRLFQIDRVPQPDGGRHQVEAAQ
jgi:hypothetical protein